MLSLFFILKRRKNFKKCLCYVSGVARECWLTWAEHTNVKHTMMCPLVPTDGVQPWFAIYGMFLYHCIQACSTCGPESNTPIHGIVSRWSIQGHYWLLAFYFSNQTECLIMMYLIWQTSKCVVVVCEFEKTQVCLHVKIEKGFKTPVHLVCAWVV